MNANQKADVYWIRFGGLLDCIRTRAHGAALLIYDNIATNEEASMVDIGGEDNAYETFTNIPGTVTIRNPNTQKPVVNQGINRSVVTLQPDLKTIER